MIVANNPQSQRAVNKSAQKQQPMMILQQNKIPNAQGSFKIKKEDLKLLQQYCENDLGLMEQQLPPTHSKNAKHQQQISHQKTKSEGATPLGTNYVKTHFQGIKTKMPINMVNQGPSGQMHNATPLYHIQQQQQQQSPFLDYQKYLEDEKIFQNQKAKSHMGYYSVAPTPQSSAAGGRQSQQSKSPDLSIQIKAAHYKSQKQHQNILAGSALSGVVGSGPLMVQPNMISQSALASYSNVQNLLLQQNSNRGSSTQQQQAPQNNNNPPTQLNRPSSRKKSNNPANPAGSQSLIYDSGVSTNLYPSLNYNQNNNNLQSMQVALFMQKNGPGKNFHKQNDDGTLEGISKDHLNESSNFLQENDPLMKSNPPNHGNKSKQQHHYNQQNHQYQSLQDESYLDASVYDQFIQGPHNISQFTAAGAAPGSNKHSILDDMNSYSQYIQRPLSQNTNVKQSNTSKLGRQSPSQKNNTTRAANAQMHSSNPKKQQRAASSIMHNSLNSSGQKQAAYDRRLMVGRTPSPNFLKRIAGLMNINNDFILPQSNLYKNTNSNMLSIQTKQRSQSKQAFSSNPQSLLPPGPQALMQPLNQQQNFIHMGSNTIQSIDKNQQQKFIKQQSAINGSLPPQLSSGAGSILTLGSRFKSGSLTTSANTPALNSPRRDPTPLQRNQIKQQKSSAKNSQQSSNNAYQQQNIDFAIISEAIKKGQVLINPQQQKLKNINDMEEKKALALVKGIKDYSIVTSKQQQNQLQLQQQYLQQQIQYQQPSQTKQIDEHNNENNDQQQFMNEDDKSFQSEIQYMQQQQLKASKGGKVKHKSNSKSVSHPQNNNMHMIDGGTGSNGISNHSIQNAGDAYQLNNMANKDQSSISVYLEQLQYLRQNQKSQLSHHPVPMIAPNTAMSPQVNKTANQFFKVQQKQLPQFNVPQLGSSVIKTQSNSKIQIKHDQDDNQININIAPKGLNQDINRDFSQDAKQQQKRKSQLQGSGVIGDHVPKITTPSVEMYNVNNYTKKGEPVEEKKDYSQKQGKHINFSNGDKTPFERELDLKTNEIKSQKKMLVGGAVTQEQLKLQKYKDDSISILKQLQESGSIVMSDLNLNTVGQQQQQMHSKKNSIDVKQRLVIDIAGGDGKKKSIIQIGGPAGGALLNPRAVNSPKQAQLMHSLNDDDEIQITQEDERQIKEVISDINHKAFYGKMLKRTKDIDCGDDETLRALSPRSREITMVMRIIKDAFERHGQPPITTTDFYRIGKMLGRGAFGKVNLAMHKLVRKLVAIKSLNKECLTDEAQKQKLMKEVSLLLKLRHNHVVKIYETIETDKHIIIVMELCAGGDLLNYVRKRRRLKEPYAKVIFKQIIDGLCYIHSKFIAHRDIKLDNILLDGKGNVKIGDFGVSKQCQKGQQKMTEQCGTPAYIAPEILKDKGYTFSVDLWSAGVVLFAMLYGTVPFKANNMEELHKLIIKGKYVLKDDITIEARNLLRGLLEVNPDKRLTIKQIYRHKWFEDIDVNLQLFNDQERDMIRKEYTYNDPRRYNRNENEEPVDCFTEHNLESVYNSLKNVTSKSIILAPFNSTQSQIMEEGMLRQSVSKLILEKMMVLKFARRCREIDRQYEFNNNGELDNGVYHKFINNTEDQDDSGNERGSQDDVDKDLLCIPMLNTTMDEGKPARNNRKGGSSVEHSFEEEINMKKLQEKQNAAMKIKEASHLQRELRRNRKNFENEIDAEMVKTFETYQSRYSSRDDQDKIVRLVQQGYPQNYVEKALDDNEPNYCTAGYYLMGMDQNYC